MTLLVLALLVSCDRARSGAAGSPADAPAPKPTLRHILSGILGEWASNELACPSELHDVVATPDECRACLPDLVRALQLEINDSWDESFICPFLWQVPQEAARRLVRRIAEGDLNGLIGSGWPGNDAEIWVDAELSAAALPLLVRKLRSPDRDIRHGALLVLPQLNVDSSPFADDLVRVMLHDRDHGIRFFACEALRKTGNGRRQAPALRAALHDENRAVRMCASRTLFGSLPLEEKFVHATSTLRSADDGLRIVAAQNLRRLASRPERALPLLRLASRDPDAAVRVGAASSLGDMAKSSIAFGMLRELCQDEYRWVRKRAIRSIAAYGEPAVNEILCAMRERPDASVMCVLTLGRIGPDARAAIPALRCMVSATPDEGLAAAAGWAIRKILGQDG